MYKYVIAPVIARSGEVLPCIEVSQATESAVLVRDTKDRGGAVLRVNAEAWRRFVTGVK